VQLADEEMPAPTIEMWPAGAAPLPTGFIASANRYGDLDHCQYANLCLATRRDLDADGAPELLIVGHEDISVFVPDGGGWSQLGRFHQSCRPEARSDPRDALRTGRLQTARPVWPDLVIQPGEPVARFQPYYRSDCGSVPVVTAPPLPPPVTDSSRPAP
jgi:hypothetical protein